MVATRGGARTGADDNLELPLRKKPVRSTTTQTASKTTTRRAATTKTKTTRSKQAKPEHEPESEQSDDVLQVNQEEETAPSMPAPKPSQKGKAAPASREQPTTARRAISRVKENNGTINPGAKARTKPIKPTKPTKPSNTRTAKVTALEEEKSAFPPTTARATRATSVKAAPLSPKKCTQVTKTQVRSTRAATSTSGKDTQAKATSTGKLALRKRNMSDENAELPKLKPVDESGDGIKVQLVNSGSQLEPETVNEQEMPFTGIVAPAEALESNDVLQDESSQEGRDDRHDYEAEQDSENVSSDELCGAKTPMKRYCPHEAVRYASSQKDSPTLSSFFKTPMKRFAVLGTQRGTPQTQKPYCKPAVPVSAMRSMTVARAQNQAMVFQRLQPLPHLRMIDGQHGASGDLDSSQNVSTAPSMDVEMDVHIQPEFNDDVMPIFDQEQDYDNVDDSVMFDIQQTDGTESAIQRPAEVYGHTPKTTSTTLPEEVEDSEDSEATIIVTQKEDGENEEETSSAFGTRSSVLGIQEEGHADASFTATSTPKPETLVWDNIQNNVTIPFNFDSDLGVTMPNSPEEKLAELPSAAANIATARGMEDYAAVNITLDGMSAEDLPVVDLNQDFGRNTGSSRASLGTVISLSDFVDLDSLSASRRVTPIFNEMAVDITTPEETYIGSDTVKNTEKRDEKGDVSPILHDTASKTSHQVSTDSQGVISPLTRPSTSARDMPELDTFLGDPQQQGPNATNIPSYALSTIASRRKSVPAAEAHRPVFDNRPKTAHGASMPHHTTFNELQRVVTPSTTSMARRQSSVTHSITRDTRNITKTPVAKIPAARTPATSVPTSIKLCSSAKTPIARILFARTPETSIPKQLEVEEQERYPGLPSRDTYEELATPLKNTPPSGAPTLAKFTDQVEHKADMATPAFASSEQNPALPPRETHELDTTASAEAADGEAPATPQFTTEERFPGLPCRRTYEEHAKTAMPVSRFQTPAKVPTKHPATTQRPASLRRAALAGARTPNKSPVKKTATATPSQELLTPHPAAPLRGVLAMVEVYTSDGGCATPVFTSLLQRLGAKTTKAFSDRVTHLIFKEGSPTTLQRLRVHNKQVAETGIGNEIHCVNSRWVSDCDAAEMRISETDDAYVVDIDDGPRSAKRRRKTMEPMSLINMDGNVVRKSSLSRASIGLSPVKFDSSILGTQTTPKPNHSEEKAGAENSPATPAYLAAPNSLIQQTAPANRVKRLELNAGKDQTKNRRLTFWNGRN